MSESQSYNLLSEPWIPVLWRNDAREPRPPNIGVRQALLRAPDIKCISHTAPFIEFGLYRLLITVVLDAYIVADRRPTIGKIKALLAAGCFDPSVLHDYLETYEDRFDLWSKEHPFLQPKPAETITPTGVAKLFPAVPSGANVVHWHHFLEEPRNASDAPECLIAEAEAAQWLTTVSPFTFKGKIGAARTLAGDPPMYALVLGTTLFETIVLNLPRASGRVTVRQEKVAGPAWRTEPSFAETKVPTVTQGFTWPVRYIRLEHSEAGIEKSVYSVAFKRTAQTRINAPVFDVRYGWRDPSAGVETSKDTTSHIKARPGVPIWRDAVPLFLVASEGESIGGERRRSRPEVISNALRVLDTPHFCVAVYGMRKKGGAGDVKLEEWFRSVLTLPTEVARDSRLSARAFDAFKTTQKVADALQTALRMLRAPSEVSKTGRKDTHRDEGDALAAFWQGLEPVLTRSYLEALAKNDSRAEDDLRGRVRSQAREAFSGAAGPQRRTADGFFRIANASHWFERRLATLLHNSSRQESEENA